MRFPKPHPKPKKARKPLRRSRMRRKRARRIDRETPQEKHWREWVHNRVCVGMRTMTSNLHLCDAAFRGIQMAHFRNMTGLGLKESNLESLPMCPRLHGEYDTTSGPFAAMGKVGKKAWFQARLIEERADYHLEHGYPIEDAGPTPNRDRDPATKGTDHDE